MAAQLSLFDDQGASRMVDVGQKEPTFRQARAMGYVSMLPETLRRILDRNVEKGNVFEVARLAGIQATKRTAELIPLCHPLGIDSVEIDIEPVDDRTVRVESRVSLHGRTGVEMEALTAVSVAALTIYDMCKSVDRGMTIGPIGLVEKSGGKSGHFRRELQHETHES
ncbi:MAG: cyclic pyranopterin monophosphate synthase MoaC [Planctomycetaceae bacterium]